MNEIKGNLWDQTDADALCITTNGFRKANGECVMGRGCALEATKRFPDIASHLGALIGKYSNRVMRLKVMPEGPILVSFPVKPVSEPLLPDESNVVRHMRGKTERVVPGWACVASTDIILQSARQLMDMADKYGWKKVVLPRPGCGAGELSWSDVKPLLESVLDHRFHVITF